MALVMMEIPLGRSLDTSGIDNEDDQLLGFLSGCGPVDQIDIYFSDMSRVCLTLGYVQFSTKAMDIATK